MSSASPNGLVRGADMSSDSWGMHTTASSSTGDQAPIKSRMRKSVRKIKGKLGVKPNEVAGGEPDKDSFLHERINDIPAFNLRHLESKEKSNAPDATQKAARLLQRVGKSIVHPQHSAKKKVKKVTAGELARTERTYLPQSADVEYLQAHDSLRQAESSGISHRNSSEDVDDTIVNARRTKIHEIEAHRESLRAAWTTSRHVQCVRVIPHQMFKYPEKGHVIPDSSETGATQASVHWLQWLGHLLLYYTQDFNKQYIDDTDRLPFDLDTTRRYLERIVMASSGWQSWLLDVRAVYRWENPRSTARWLALYLILWYTEHIMGFVYAFVIYTVLRRRFYPGKLESLRASTERALDSRRKARKLVELVDKHGPHYWLEPVMEQMGPYAQLQLCDLANLLEVLTGFYEWERPVMTLCSIAFFGSCLLVTLLTDMAFCMKIVWFIVGGTFFFCWPISSLYPRYRYLVSPFKWIFWNIPTHAEWSFLYLRGEAIIMQQELVKEKSSIREFGRAETGLRGSPELQHCSSPSMHESTDEDWDSARSTISFQIRNDDIRSFSGYSKKSRGWLIISWSAVRFVNIITHTEPWRIQYHDLAYVRKAETGSKLKPLSSRQVLEFENHEGDSFSITAIRERDEAFNSIIAFSGLQWQSLQPLSSKP